MQSAPDHLQPFLTKLLHGSDAFWDVGVSAITAAYEAGREAGRNEAAADLRQKLAGVLETVAPALPTVSAPSDEAQEIVVPDRRAARGSVRPIVVEALREYGEPGLRPSEISARTGVNENSVRGALNHLAKERVLKKQGDLWTLS